MYLSRKTLSCHKITPSPIISRYPEGEQPNKIILEKIKLNIFNCGSFEIPLPLKQHHNETNMLANAGKCWTKLTT